MLQKVAEHEYDNSVCTLHFCSSCSQGSNNGTVPWTRYLDLLQNFSSFVFPFELFVTSIFDRFSASLSAQSQSFW